MTDELIHQWARELLNGQLSADQFKRQVLRSAADDLGHTVLDTDRARRCGFPEVVYGQGKTIGQLTSIVASFQRRRQRLLVTRVADDALPRLQELLPDAIVNPVARTLRWEPAGGVEHDSAGGSDGACRVRPVAVITAGTTDRPVAEESLETLAWMQIPARPLWDVGVAGPQRLLTRLSELEGIACAVVVAGMEGALPSVVGGWLDCPVIAVPTSVGYGANLQGITALLGMLISCAANVAVVNIDAGFKAGYLAGLIASRTEADSPISVRSRESR
ncbi:MAG: nickel pincer cofactor biosynthesis protein LarB [Pirellulales bacterium]